MIPDEEILESQFPEVLQELRDNEARKEELEAQFKEVNELEAEAWREDEYIVWHTASQETITTEGLSNSSAHLIPKGTLILGTRINVGACVICTFDTAINQDLKALYLKEDYSKEYFLYFINAQKAVLPLKNT